MDIHFYAKSDVGRVRNGNEDFFLNEKIGDSEYLFCVADGMGGHLAGDVASKLASEKFLENYKANRKKKLSIPEAMELAIRKANQAILKKAENDPMKRGMGTTFSAIVIHDRLAHVIHIGDSRIYFIRDNRLRRLTTDHTFVEKLVENGRISVEEAREHPQKNVLYMSLGAREGFFPEIIKEIQLQDGDAVVLCSDGLSNMIHEEELKETVLSMLPQDAVEELVDRANRNGGTDNITLQVVRIGSIESLEKTKPVKITGIRKRKITFLSLIGLVLAVTSLWVLFRQWKPGDIDLNSAQGSSPETASQFHPAPHLLHEIAADSLRSLKIQVGDLQVVSGKKLLIQRDHSQILFDFQKGESATYYQGKTDYYFPSMDGEVYCLRKSADSRNQYTLYQWGAKPKSVLKVPAKETAFPMFLNRSAFLFSDFRQVYVVKDFHGKDLKKSTVFPILELTLHDQDQLFFQRKNNDYFMTIFQPREKWVKVFRIDSSFSRVFQMEHLDIDPPLAVEYTGGEELVFYFSGYSLKKGSNSSQALRRHYRFPNYQAHIVRVLIDQYTAEKVLVADDFRIYLMS